MSWSTSGEVAKTRLAEDLPEPYFSDDEEVRPAQDQQFFRAMQAAEQLVQAVGQDDVKVYVSLSGHANPHHGSREGYSEECITVSVSVASKPSLPTKEETTKKSGSTFEPVKATIKPDQSMKVAKATKKA